MCLDFMPGRIAAWQKTRDTDGYHAANCLIYRSGPVPLATFCKVIRFGLTEILRALVELKANLDLA
jgi:hypothetical protein